MSFSIAILEGRLGKDPEIKTTGSGSKYCKFSVAVERSYKNGDERITDWVDCTCWNAACDFLEKWFHKGDPISVQGTLEVSKWTDKDGNKRQSMEVHVDKLRFTESKKGASGGSGSTSTVTDYAEIDDDDELPFI